MQLIQNLFPLDLQQVKGSYLQREPQARMTLGWLDLHSRLLILPVNLYHGHLGCSSLFEMILHR